MKKELKEDLERLISYIPNENIEGKSFKVGWENEAKQLREKMESNSEITESWCARDLVIPLIVPKNNSGIERGLEFEYPPGFFSGSYNFCAISQNLVHIHSFDNPPKELLEYRNKIFTEVLKTE